VAKGGEALGWKTSGEEDGVRRLYMGWMGKKRAVMKEWRVKWGVKGWREQLGGWRDRVASRSGVDGKDQTRQSTGGVRIDTSEGLHGWMGCHRQYVQGGYVHGAYDSGIFRIREDEDGRRKEDSESAHLYLFLEGSGGGNASRTWHPHSSSNRRGEFPGLTSDVVVAVPLWNEVWRLRIP
jgi:hypothetical protein